MQDLDEEILNNVFMNSFSSFCKEYWRNKDGYKNKKR